MQFQSKDAWLLRMLSVVKTRPGMWVPGPETARNLETYLLGYQQARADLGVPARGAGEETLLEDFARWMADRLRTEKQLSWAGYVQEADSGPKSVYTFFRLFEEFLATSGTKLPPPEEAGWPADEWSIDGDG